MASVSPISAIHNCLSYWSMFLNTLARFFFGGGASILRQTPLKRQTEKKRQKGRHKRQPEATDPFCFLSASLRSVSVCRTDLMAVDRFLGLFAHRFFMISVLIWPAVWSTFGRTIKYWLIDRMMEFDTNCNLWFRSALLLAAMLSIYSKPLVIAAKNDLVLLAADILHQCEIIVRRLNFSECKSSRTHDKNQMS